MKKLISNLIPLFFLSLSLSAQYKKASFFGKEGRTYEFGTQMYMLGDGKGNPVGFKLAFGRDQEGKRFFSAWELQFIPSYKYAYTTTNENSEPVTVNGKSQGTFIYALNYCFHLLKN